MLVLPDGLMQATLNRSQADPAVWLDVYTGEGLRDSIKDWAEDDPYLAADSNVDSQRTKGALTLADDSQYINADSSGAKDGLTTLTTTYKQTDNYAYPGWFNYNILGDSYDFASTAVEKVSGSSGASFRFQANASSLLDSLYAYCGFESSLALVKVLSASSGLSGVVVEVAQTPSCMVAIHDEQGQVVGKTVSKSLGKNAALLLFKGFDASLLAGKTYSIQFYFSVVAELEPQDGINTNTAYRDFSTTFTVQGLSSNLLSQSIQASKDETATASEPTSFPIGGYRGFVAKGTASRLLDVGKVPENTGVFSLDDIVPSGTVLRVDLQASNSLINWAYQRANIQSGEQVPAFRYVKLTFTLNANQAGDRAPALLGAHVYFDSKPQTFSNIADVEVVHSAGFIFPAAIPLALDQARDTVIPIATRAIHSVSRQSAQLSPALAQSMVGKVAVSLEPHAKVNALMNLPLRNKRADIWVGYRDIGKIKVWSGLVEDASFKQTWRLDLKDDFELKERRVPEIKAVSWQSGKAYKLGDNVAYSADGYRCTTAHTAIAPPPSAYWSATSSVWLTVDYSPESHAGEPWHLVDIVKDMLTNHINIRREKIDLSALEAIRQRFPQRTGSRFLSQPKPAKELLSELAWLLEAQWVVRKGLLSLVAESSDIQAFITPKHIKLGSVAFRRGWKELVNTALCFTAYSGDGDADEQFNGGEVYLNEESFNAYGANLKTFHDKWSTPTAELQARLKNYVNNYQDGRRVVTCQVAMTMMALEAGDVVQFESAQLPSNQPQPLTMMVLRKDEDWLKQSISLTLLEVAT